MTDEIKPNPLTSLQSLLSRIDAELKGETQVGQALLSECHRAILAFSVRLSIYHRTLEDIAKHGTHHDRMPTRKLPPMENKLAWEIDEWWSQYFLNADDMVRAIAGKPLENETMHNRLLDFEELSWALQGFGQSERDAEGIANQMMNMVLRRRYVNSPMKKVT
jgi:hypothetical protein